MVKFDLESVRFVTRHGSVVEVSRKCSLCDMSRKGRERVMVLDGRLPTHGQERGPVYVTEVGANDE
jgi:hypothetical protein